jgi:hypothetical protein
MLDLSVSVPAPPKLSHTTTKLPVLSIATGGNNWLLVGPPGTGCAKATGSQARRLVVRSTSIRDLTDLPNTVLFRAL